MDTTPSTVFSPPDTTKVINDLLDPSLTFRCIADANDTTVEALALWCDSPPIRRRLRNIRSFIARRNAHMATNYLVNALEALRESITSYHYEETHHPINSSSLTAIEQRRRSRETMIRAAKILYHVANPTRKPRLHSKPIPSQHGINVMPAPKREKPKSHIPADAFYKPHDFPAPIRSSPPQPITINNKPRRAATLASTAGAAPNTCATGSPLSPAGYP